MVQAAPEKVVLHTRGEYQVCTMERVYMLDSSSAEPRATLIPRCRLLLVWEGSSSRVQLGLKRCSEPQMPGQTYQCQDAVGMFLQGTGLIVRILPRQIG